MAQSPNEPEKLARPRPGRRSVRLTTRALAAALLLLVAVGVYLVLVATAPHPEPAPAHREPPRIPVYTVARLPVQRQFQGYGSARALHSADVPARISATVVQVPDAVLEGNAVAKGEVIAKLDPADFQQQLAVAEQRVAELGAQRDRLVAQRKELQNRVGLERRDQQLARQDLDRVKELNANAAGNPQEVNQYTRQLLTAQRSLSATRETLQGIDPQLAGLKARLASERANLELARLNVQRTTITSPIAGVLQSVDVEVGESVQPGQAVARVVDLSRIEVPLRLPAAARPYLAVGDHATLTATDDRREAGADTDAEDASGDASGDTSGGGGLIWDARLTRIAPVDDSGTRTVTVYVVVDQQGALAGSEGEGAEDRRPLLVPGAFVSGRVVSGQTRPRLVVPRRAVHSGRVLAVVDGKVSPISISIAFTLRGALPGTGLEDQQWVVLDDEAEGGVTAGTPVLINASTALRSGQAVRPVPAASEALEGGDQG